MLQPLYIGYVAWPEISKYIYHYFADSSGSLSLTKTMTVAQSTSPADNWLFYKPTPEMWYLCGMAVAWLTIDLGVMIIWAKELIAVHKQSFYNQLLMHHVFSKTLEIDLLSRITLKIIFQNSYYYAVVALGLRLNSDFLNVHSDNVQC